jgi:hypothetical protein
MHDALRSLLLALLTGTLLFGDTTHQQHDPCSESLGFSIAYRGPGEYTLVEVVRDQERPHTLGASYYEADGDVLISSYHATDDTSANQLTITSYDSTTEVENRR